MKQQRSTEQFILILNILGISASVFIIIIGIAILSWTLQLSLPLRFGLIAAVIGFLLYLGIGKMIVEDLWLLKQVIAEERKKIRSQRGLKKVAQLDYAIDDRENPRQFERFWETPRQLNEQSKNESPRHYLEGTVVDFVRELEKKFRGQVKVDVQFNKGSWEAFVTFYTLISAPYFLFANWHDIVESFNLFRGRLDNSRRELSEIYNAQNGGTIEVIRDNVFIENLNLSPQEVPALAGNALTIPDSIKIQVQNPRNRGCFGGCSCLFTALGIIVFALILGLASISIVYWTYYTDEFVKQQIELELIQQLQSYLRYLSEFLLSLANSL